MSINPLTTTNTFKQWFDKTNEIIGEVNGITIHNLIAGDGITLTSNGNNVYTIKHGTSVGTAVTFTGPVTFTNTVTFTNNPSNTTTVLSYSPVITGITIGNVVRSTSGGLTLSKADTGENSEILGIVVNTDNTSYTIATAGKIDNTLFATTIPNMLGIVGGTLSPGCSYFLNPDVAGGVTSIEPTTYGKISKPVILGITFNSGLFLPYRGIQIEGISAGITAELDNKIIVSIDYTNDTSSLGGAVKPGDPIFYWDDTESGKEDLLGYFNGNGTRKVIGKLNNSNYDIAVIGASPNLNTSNIQEVLTGKWFLGIVSKVISNTSNIYILEVTLPGGSFNVDWTGLDTKWYLLTGTPYTTSLGIGATGSFSSDRELQNKFLDFIVTDSAISSAKIIVANKTTGGASEVVARSASISASGNTASLEYDNLIPNGSFTIWQRGWSNLTGVTVGGLSAFNTPIADRWFYITDSSNITGLTASIERKEFDSDQIVVPGSPRYWLDLKQSFSSVVASSNRPRLENIQKGARLIQGQEATLTFYGKAGVAGTSLDIFYNRYKDSYANSTETRSGLSGRTIFAAGVTLAANWEKYSYTFTTAAWGNTLASTEEGWFSLGFEFPSSGITCSISQVKLELGSDSADYVYTSPEKELERCSPYYLRTYDWDQLTGYTGTSRLNEQQVNLGNLLSQKVYTIKFPVETVQDPSSVVLYSITGVKDEAYNFTKQADMRFPRCETCLVHVNLPWDISTQRTALPSGNIVVQSKTKNGMQVVINNGATHLDTLIFHYVADADIKLT